jgi:NAD+ synthase (glutamine-hydrolysing)
MGNNYGFVKACAVTPNLRVGDTLGNTEEIIKCIDKAAENNVSIILFPELCITGYTCNDLFQQEVLLRSAENRLIDISLHVSSEHVVVVGLPLEINGRLFNCAAVLSNQKIIAIIPKSFLPNYKEFYEDRWFHSGIDLDETITIGGQDVLVNPFSIIEIGCQSFSFKLGIEICEDLWTPLPPSALLSLAGAEVILNLSASNETIGKASYRRELVSQNSSRNICGYLYASAGVHESTTDVVFSGHRIAAEYGSILSESILFERNSSFTYCHFDIDKIRAERRRVMSFGKQVSLFERGYYGNHKIKIIKAPALFSSVKTEFNPLPFVPSNNGDLDKRVREIFDIQANALATRLESCNIKKVVIGISGGLDSTLALLVAVKAFKILYRDLSDIIGITMPGFGTSERTKSNAEVLMEKLGIASLCIDITDGCKQTMKDIGLDPDNRTVTYENVQARKRTEYLMDYANLQGGIVLGTGDLSEAALGWCTYNGDHMSMYGVNSSIPKTLVKWLVICEASKDEFIGVHDQLIDICHTPISPELLPPDQKGNIAQETEDIIGPYELHDFFLYNLIRWNYSPDKIEFMTRLAFPKYSSYQVKKWLSIFYKRFFTMSQFKRDCVPGGPKVGSISLSPRGDWRMPAYMKNTLWI